ncbi:DUF3087 domain-containing protein [Pseudomonas sp. HMWF032]|uniref:DUF3087 family protein n=1 Tax=Pseudomonas sp. HMWF032 TaxID=2056866 RepID=UPI000D393133|nr:DUF3087 family protein [Pseudomonas sp. HMWF032]PTS86644.1 DUF3087 domain-containing protein [Pseudomonas sp. HMWF032]PTT83902.1 DUF3087 domain-containing protein [Pseudomonas sp. HMWF010]
MFEIQPFNPEHYRQQTRRSTVIIALSFVATALLLSTLTVTLFGQPDGDNFRWNLAGVVLALLLTAAVVRRFMWSQPWMAAAAYGWQLKRSLMRITNVMHHVKAGVTAHDPQAMCLLRFYHQGLTQMHQLDGNSSGLSEAVAEINRHLERMESLEMDTDQPRLDPVWLEHVKKISPLPG